MNDNDDDITTYQDNPNSSLQTKINKLSEEAAAQKTRTWSHYQKILKENPDKYWKPKTQAQMFKDASALGDSFKDGDFYD
jgi:hypothetical protein